MLLFKFKIKNKIQELVPTFKDKLMIYHEV